MADTLARRSVARYFPDQKLDSGAEAQLRQLDEAVNMMYEGRVATIYMHGKKIVQDPGRPESFLGTPVDVARLFLANGIRTAGGNVIPYSATNRDIKCAEKKLTEEIEVLLIPQTLMIDAETKNFEKQQAALLRLLTENNKEPFPADKFISQLVAERFVQNILPLTLPPADRNIANRQLRDIFSVMQRQCFDQLKETLAPILTEIDGAMSEAKRPGAPRAPAAAVQKDETPGQGPT